MEVQTLKAPNQNYESQNVSIELSLHSVSNSKSSGVKQENSSKAKGPPRKHPCDKCPYVAVSLTSLYNHVKIVHDNIREHVCAECGFKSGTSHGLMAHTKSVHLKIREAKSS